MLCFFTVPSIAQNPVASRGEQLLSINQEECMSRARAALQAEGYTFLTSGTYSSVFGGKAIHTAGILCNIAPEGKMWVNIVVASIHNDMNVPGAERVKLQRQMAQPGTGGGMLEGEWDIKCCNNSLEWTLSITKQEGNTFSGSFSAEHAGGVVTNGQLRGNTIEFDRSGGGWRQHWSAQLVNDGGGLRIINGIWTGDYLDQYQGRNNWHAEKKK